MNRRIIVLAIAVANFAFVGALHAFKDGNHQEAQSAADVVLKDHPAVYWRFSEPSSNKQPRSTTDKVGPGAVWGRALLGQMGPRPPRFPQMESKNTAAEFMGREDFIKVLDPGDASVLDFTNGDSMTLEAWVSPRSISNNQTMVIVEKGRTGNKGFEEENLNYALRLRGSEDQALLNFLFRSVRKPGETSFAYHRWTSSRGFPADSGWHHVAISYTFGVPESIRGYVDGVQIEGQWDMAGPTNVPPVTDNDELWIGSGSANHSGAFNGWIDEVAIHRSTLNAQQIAARYVVDPKEPNQVVGGSFLTAEEIPEHGVRAQVFEGLPDRSWGFTLGSATYEYTLPAVALDRIPNKYTSSGVIDDRQLPFLLQMDCKRTMPAGHYRFLIRSKSATKLWIDGKEIASTRFQDSNGDGHEPVPDLINPFYPTMHPCPHGHRESVVEIDLSEGQHLFRFDAMIGGRVFRPEPGEICVAYSIGDSEFELLTPENLAPISLSESDWQRLMHEEASRVAEINATNRKLCSEDYQLYWDRRHELARNLIQATPHSSDQASIDTLIAAHALTSLEEALHIEDSAFLRRLSLDTHGVIPSASEVEAFLADRSTDKRQRAIARALASPAWADHWVGYWQDVLAENPGIVKPEQNNTGPFRWWIYESFLDNKPFDRFATELIMMEGSKYYGGPAGFAMASQNDAPMAAKAQVIAKAFLGMELTCARCHDAPNSPFKQQELFSLAAMLQRAPLTLPKASTVPASTSGRVPLVTISLKAGDQLRPEWHLGAFPSFDLPEGLLRNPDDLREQFAARVTSPTNPRFAKVIANRLWHRYMGWSIVESIDDWDSNKLAESPLLDYLSNQLILSGYDLKHVARLILESNAYQAQAYSVEAIKNARQEAQRKVPGPAFAYPLGPARRRMTSEQVIDSMVAATGKGLEVEPMSLDPEGRRPPDQFLHLGTADRAWQLASTSTDRDRPALNMPATQQVVDVMVAFGWRDARPAAQTVRDDSASPIQSLILGNGWSATRMARLSDNHRLTQAAISAPSLDGLISHMVRMSLSRDPKEEERAIFTALLEPGYANRIVEPLDSHGSASQLASTSLKRNAVSWANHLVPRATEIKLALEQEILRGDEPTHRLDPDWRERLEDAWWALLNSPEFLFVP